ncbi:hypothetical protein Tco_1112366 [Tanacetum coccineum]|uniref:Uncharacterized protein n=1 Tax=Tanacetum coccineum TaxID=301880 RepID=A0ABQ5IS46_9ASTR
MSAMANTTGDLHLFTEHCVPYETDVMPKANILNLCEEHYDDILPIIMDRIRRDKRKEIQTILDFGGSSKKTRKARDYSLSSSDGKPPARHRHTLRVVTRQMLETNDDKRVQSFKSPKEECVRTSQDPPPWHRRIVLEISILTWDKKLCTVIAPMSRITPDATKKGGQVEVLVLPYIASVLQWRTWKIKKKGTGATDEDLAYPGTCEDVDPFNLDPANFKFRGRHDGLTMWKNLSWYR